MERCVYEQGASRQDGVSLEYTHSVHNTHRSSGLRSLISTSSVTIPMMSLVPVPASLCAAVPDEARVLEGEVTDWIWG